MQRKIGFIAAILVMAVAALGASRQPADVAVRIPFDFMVGRHMLPAGNYRVEPVAANMVRIKSVRGISSVMVGTEQPVKITPRPLRLVFNHESRPPQLVGVFGEREISRQLAANPSRSLTVITTKPGEVLASDSGVQRY